MKTLIVDDHKDNLFYMQALAEIDGHDVILHHEATHAIEVARAGQPDIIVLDVVLPGKLNGLDIARQIRADEQLRDVYILATTAAPEMYTEKMALAAGCDGYLPKPFGRQQWQNAIAGIAQTKTD